MPGGLTRGVDSSEKGDADRVVDVYKRSWNQLVSTPQNPRPSQAIDANGTEHVYVFRALDGIAPKDVTIARSVREVISGTQPDISRTYVGYHVTGEVTEDMPKNTTLNYEGRFIGHRNTQFTAAQNPQMGSAQYNGTVTMQASLTDGGGTVSGTLDGQNGFHAARTRIDFAGDVSGATFEARQLSITPNNSNNTDIVSIKDTSAVQGAFFGPGASEVGGVFLVEGEWRLAEGSPTAPYHFAGSFFGEPGGRLKPTGKASSAAFGARSTRTRHREARKRVGRADLFVPKPSLAGLAHHGGFTQTEPRRVPGGFRARGNAELAIDALDITCDGVLGDA